MKDKSSLKSLEDMPDDRWVIALIRMIQIEGDEMSEIPNNLLPALRQYQHNDCSGLLPGFDYDGTVEIVSHLNSEIARLNALVAMQAEALSAAIGYVPELKNVPGIKQVLTATSETVSAYQNEVKAKVWEELLKKYAIFNSEEYAWLSNSILDDISELRAKGE